MLCWPVDCECPEFDQLTASCFLGELSGIQCTYADNVLRNQLDG